MKKYGIFIALAMSDLFKYKAECADIKCLADSWKVMQVKALQNAERSRPGANNGLLKFLLDSRNIPTPGIVSENVQFPADGKSHILLRSFVPRRAAQTENAPFAFCGTEGESLQYKVDAINIDKVTRSQPMLIDEAYLRCILEGKEEVRQDTIQQFARVYLDMWGRQVAAEFTNHVGKFAKSGVTCKDLPLFLANGQSINPTADVIIAQDMMQAETTATPVLVGGTLLESYRILRPIASANLAGFDASLLGMMPAMYRDTNFEALGVNRIYAIIPGAIKLWTANLNVGDFANGTNQQKLRSTFIDPWFGVEHDIYIWEEDCAEAGVKTYIQFAIRWVLAGYPDCWSDDPQFEGVTDVYCYNGVCSDAGVCTIEPATGLPAGIPEATAPCNGYEPCDTNCNARFLSQCSEKALFVYSGSAAIIADVQINGMFIDLGADFDTSDATQFEALLAALRVKLASFGNIKSISGNLTLGTATINIIADTNIATIDLIRSNGASIVMARTVSFYYNIVDQSTPSSSATSYTLTWTPPAGSAFAGAPSDSILEPGFFGQMSNFYAEVAEGGSFTVDILDNTGCTATFTDLLVACAGLEFEFEFTAFDDENDNDIQDGGELGLQDIKLLVYKGLGATELVSEVITDVAGAAAFSLETGVYNLRIDTTYGAAVGRSITTAIPKYFEIDLAGAVIYGAGWSEDGLVPIGPLV